MDTIYLTLAEVADILEISKTQVWNLIDAEEIRFTRYRRRLIVKLEHLHEYTARKSTRNPLRNPPAPAEFDKSPPVGSLYD